MDRTTRKTKIIATIGPASSSAEMLERLIKSGVDVFRLNFSHGTRQEKGEIIETVRKLSLRLERPIGILADLQGPKIRTGKMEGGGVLLEQGEKVIITTDNLLGRSGVIPTTYVDLPKDVKPGAQILLDDGLLQLKVISVSVREVTCEVVVGGLLKDNKGINLPGVSVSAPSLTEKDREDLEFCLEAGIDFIALSFVRTSADVEQLKRIIQERGSSVPVVAKIEKPEALANLESIIAASDVIMVARGDLGVEMLPERVPVIQKKIIRLCNEAGKPVITATQMLESMIGNPRPTRAETSDVANAILDGTDSVMLSGETASGKYPVEAVTTMVKVARDVEQSELILKTPAHRAANHVDIAEAVAEAACRAATILEAKAIVAFTQTGGTAALISKFRPQLPIIAISPLLEIQRRLSLFWGVHSWYVETVSSTDQQIAAMEKALLAMGFQRGDVVVITMGTPIATKGSTNMIKVHKLGTGGM